MRELEGAQALLEAEEAVDDPLRMARALPNIQRERRRVQSPDSGVAGSLGRAAG